eukprot:TRINITY_DN101060_c0_g1_i1.p1 TRINITY_DN101060_c0_g1~~TRINITY_DN101060_c0_g1_i1.p1  ORF type:complete len:122 (+),score=8.64 TRINITY_DN101060_c0_g1_i1:207-572(+)
MFAFGSGLHPTFLSLHPCLLRGKVRVVTKIAPNCFLCPVDAAVFEQGLTVSGIQSAVPKEKPCIWTCASCDALSSGHNSRTCKAHHLTRSYPRLRQHHRRLLILQNLIRAQDLAGMTAHHS